MDPLDFHFKYPTTIQVSRPTRCGKTKLVCCILETQLIYSIATRINWVHNEWKQNNDMIRVRNLSIVCKMLER